MPIDKLIKRLYKHTRERNIEKNDIKAYLKEIEKIDIDPNGE